MNALPKGFLGEEKYGIPPSKLLAIEGNSAAAFTTSSSIQCLLISVNRGVDFLHNLCQFEIVIVETVAILQIGSRQKLVDIDPKMGDDDSCS